MGKPSRALSFFIIGTAAALLVGAIGLAAPALASETPAAQPSPDVAPPDAELPSAPVEIDGVVLFRVRGTSAFPAGQRAEAIAARIEALAADSSMSADAVGAVEVEGGTGIVAGSQRLMLVQEADARLESVDRQALALAIVRNVRKAVADYRQARSREALIRSAVLGGVATAIFAALLVLVIWLSRRARAVLEKRYRHRIPSLQIQSFQILGAEHIWGGARRALDGSRAIVILVMAFIYVQYVLGLLPWTRGIANRLLGYVLGPLTTMGRGIGKEMPDLIFLVILFLATRYLLRLIHLFFGAVGRGEVTLSGFHREWADSTYKLVRVAVIVFALVVAYPYVPGSGTDAFKGLSIFIGILFSLGSSSAISNLIAGYTMIYRRAYKVGDRVKIGDTVGDVTEMRLQVTHLKTVKHEEVFVPNSVILQSHVVNYSSLERREGLILHTTVGIGYGTPWRQVEAMLLIAAERTAGLMKEPAPFILQNALDNFQVTYELNVYCDNAQAMIALYTSLHRNILDVFNEYGVQIMTPAYRGDPEVPKVVPKERWFREPAKRERDEA